MSQVPIDRIFETRKGHPCIQIGNYKFRMYSELQRTQQLKFACCNKNCRCVVYTDLDCKFLIRMKYNHNHEPYTDAQLNVERVRASAKRRATEDEAMRTSGPTEVVESVLRSCEGNEEADIDLGAFKQLTKSVYQARKKKTHQGGASSSGGVPGKKSRSNKSTENVHEDGNFHQNHQTNFVEFPTIKTEIMDDEYVLPEKLNPPIIPISDPVPRQRRSESELISAAQMVQQGAPFLEASQKFDIPISTLGFYMARKGMMKQPKSVHEYSSDSDNENLVSSSDSDVEGKKIISSPSSMDGLRLTFLKYLKSGKLTDVTLACEDGSVKCHKIILSAKSQTLSHIINKLPSKDHSVIFLKDIELWELKALIKFMYRGKIYVEKEKLERINKSAQSLKIHGFKIPVQSQSNHFEVISTENLEPT